MKKYLPFGILAVALMAALIVIWWPREDKQLWAKSFLGKCAPAFAVQKWISREPDRAGKFVLIDFWATWCPPCLKTVKELNGFHQKFGDRLVVIGLSEEEEDVVRKFTEENIKYYIAVDTSAALKNQYGVTGLPHCVIINPAGIVVWEGYPLLKGDELTEGVIASLLSAGK
jgi:thiol-disulfide isomerase/thioredoxin